MRFFLTNAYVHRRILLLLLMLFFCVPLHAMTIRMAWFAVPPHVYVSSDGVHPAGRTIDLFNAIAAKMGCGEELVGPIPLSRLGQYQKYGGGNISVSSKPFH